MAGGLAVLSPGEAVPPGGLPATVRSVDGAADERRFPVYDASGRRSRTAAWRVTAAGGNCCEVFVAATSAGRLVEFGGTYPMTSDDRGTSWQQVRPGTPLLGGEGAISAAPGGDVVGVGWDAYTGDHLQAFKYDGEARTWTYAEVPLHEPVYDRPWIAVVPGTFRLPDGRVSDYATVVRANYLSAFRETFLVSYDGLSYTPTTDLATIRLGGAANGFLDVAAVRDLDYAQPHRGSRLAALGAGRLLNILSPKPATCPATVWSSANSTGWSCVSMPDHAFAESLVVDSRGWLHEVSPDEGGLAYRVSNDGGRTWREASIAMPDADAAIDGATLIDHKAHGALGVAAVAAHVRIGAFAQDVVFRVDVSGATPRLVETLYVGRGDTQPGKGVSETGARFDFVSVAILPDGTFATAFHDSTSNDPLLAVEVREPRRRR
jgi:hypothetical protein